MIPDNSFMWGYRPFLPLLMQRIVEFPLLLDSSYIQETYNCHDNNRICPKKKQQQWCTFSHSARGKVYKRRRRQKEREKKKREFAKKKDSNTVLSLSSILSNIQAYLGFMPNKHCLYNNQAVYIQSSKALDMIILMSLTKLWFNAGLF